MPAALQVRIIFPGDIGHAEGAKRSITEVSCIRRLIEDAFASHNDLCIRIFGFEDAKAVLQEWAERGIAAANIGQWVDELRQAAFEADHIGETLLEIRNNKDMSDIPPGSVPVFCAVLEYLAASCGPDGVVRVLPLGEE